MENLKIENVTKEYRESALLDNVTFDLEKGKVYGLLGKNGAGKTTLLKIIVKLIPMDNYKGRVKILDSEKKISALI
ncbi:ATP-binding cassette domain-containing protein [Peptococcus simiae]|uniref:ATP-binding cassette domain-containing protein n=1 Tax=Peptococcus simiae TaxID=1643805 RepID=A0ABW9H0S9_9FIRM